MKHLPPLQGKSLLEVGPGNLVLTKELLENGLAKATVIDFSQLVVNAFDEIPADFQSRIQLIIDDYMKIPIPGKFDLIIACEVLEHLENDEDFLLKTTENLYRFGTAIFSMPARIKYWSIHDEMVGHYRRYEKSRLLELFSKVGYKNIHIISYGFPFINIFRIFRILWTKSHSINTSHLSIEERTMKSGFYGNYSRHRILDMLIDPSTFYPMNLFSSLFNDFDYSEGYLVISRKI